MRASWGWGCCLTFCIQHRMLLSEELERLMVASSPALIPAPCFWTWRHEILLVIYWTLTLPMISSLLLSPPSFWSHLYYILQRCYKISGTWLALVIYFQCGINSSLSMGGNWKGDRESSQMSKASLCCYIEIRHLVNLDCLINHINLLVNCYVIVKDVLGWD